MNTRYTFKKMMRSTLTPEQQEAFGNFISAFATWEQTIIQNPILSIDNICTTNTCFFTTTTLDTTTLPREASWLWNKSKRSQTVSLNEHVTVTFYKLNTRKARRAIVEPPNFKVWLFDVTIRDAKIHFFWCERGLGAMEITVNDLEFLRPYFSTATAAQFYGWTC